MGEVRLNFRRGAFALRTIPAQSACGRARRKGRTSNPVSPQFHTTTRRETDCQLCWARCHALFRQKIFSLTEKILLSVLHAACRRVVRFLFERTFGISRSHAVI